ncbi:MAG: class I SAM-dependent methyltransferase [Actinomycetota bacterium]
MSRWSRRKDVLRGEDYDKRWRDLEASGVQIHGEADLVDWFEPTSVLDAGCGTGRVAIELDRRGRTVVGVDNDPRMLAPAIEKAPELRWIDGDLLDVHVDDGHGGRQRFDVVVAAGNVMVFLEPGTEGAVVVNLSAHLAPGGRLISGFQLKAHRMGLAVYDRHCDAAGLKLEHRWSTWERDAWDPLGDYAVSVHRLDAVTD